MRITIYQIIPELDRDGLMFMPLSYFQKTGHLSPSAGIYESVFCGEIEAFTLEKIYQIFNRTNQADTRYLESIGFTGHSMSVSDILEIQDSPKESRFYFCDAFGFPQISFQKEIAMLTIQNHTIFLMNMSVGLGPLIWHMWITAGFPFIPALRFNSCAVNAVNVNSATSSVINRKSVGGRENFWNVLLSFYLKI